MKTLAAILLISLSLSGCLLFTTFESLPLSGRVENAKTGTPIQGANVSIKQKPSVFIVTSEDGTFNLPEKWEGFWGPPLPIDTFRPKVIITITADGFEPTDIDPHPYWEDKSHPVIKLQPKH